MGLFELLQRITVRLGLMSKAVKSLPYISFLALVGCITLILVLPMDGQYRNTYISENALLPAQAQTYFRESEWNIVRGYREEVHLLENKTEIERTMAVKSWLDDIGLKTSLHYWDKSYGSENKSGINVYGILHAPRGENTEAMVLVAPWINKDGEFNDGGVSLVVSLARYLQRWTVWSKNIIFVVTSDSHLSMRSWVSDYHTSMANTAGAIEAAVVLDYPSKSDYFDQIEISYEGLNGQLPNLDLINTAVIIANHENIRVMIQNMANVTLFHYKQRLLTLFRGIISQLSAGLGPGPGSETFSGWRIHAITLRARGTSGPSDITTFGRVAESTLRSVNNLLEHFHQSFFFYFLLSPRRFVSIGTYLPSAIILAIAFPLMALYNFATVPAFNQGTPKEAIANHKKQPPLTFWANASSTSPTKMVLLAPSLLISAIFGFCWVVGYLSVYLFSTRSVVISIQAITAFHLLFTIFYLISKTKENINKEGAARTRVGNPLSKINANWVPKFPVQVLLYTQAYAMILYGLILTTVSMLNFSLGLFLGVVSIPLAYVSAAAPLRSTILLFISSPWVWLRVISWLTECMGNSSSFGKLVGLEKITSELLWSWRGMDVWTWGIVVGVWLPFWLVGLVVSSCSVDTIQDGNYNSISESKLKST